jgi:hypothetical protein
VRLKINRSPHYVVEMMNKAKHEKAKLLLEVEKLQHDLSEKDTAHGRFELKATFLASNSYW